MSERLNLSEFGRDIAVLQRSLTLLLPRLMDCCEDFKQAADIHDRALSIIKRLELIAALQINSARVNRDIRQIAQRCGQALERARNELTVEET